MYVCRRVDVWDLPARCYVYSISLPKLPTFWSTLQGFEIKLLILSRGLYASPLPYHEMMDRVEPELLCLFCLRKMTLPFRYMNRKVEEGETSRTLKGNIVLTTESEAENPESHQLL